MDVVTLVVKKERVGPVRGRHPWVFSGALKSIPDKLKAGSPILLKDDAGVFLAHGYFNSYSQIAVRLWSWEENEKIDQQFFNSKISTALELRQQYVASKATNAWRLIHGENDLLPGLVVDNYNGVLVVQFHTAGIEAWKKEIITALVEIVKPTGIFERSDVRDRLRNQPVILSEANAPQGDRTPSVGVLYGDVPDKVRISENGVLFNVDVKTGQKTGFFLDQRDKRLALQKYVKNKRVLNCFSYTGGFSVYALVAGAAHVTSIDASVPALEMAEENLKLNNLDEANAEFIAGDVKEYLAEKTTSDFDVIILDPPAFVKDRHKIKEGMSGYKKINQAAISILPPGGILVTASCSAHVGLEDFRFMLVESAGRAGRTIQILETFTHGIDHPELAAYTEGEYLKCFFVKVL